MCSKLLWPAAFADHPKQRLMRGLSPWGEQPGRACRQDTDSSFSPVPILENLKQVNVMELKAPRLNLDEVSEKSQARRARDRTGCRRLRGHHCGNFAPNPNAGNHPS